MTNKTITVVITSYRYRDFIAQAIDSVLAQTRKPDEILVVDDGAHDGACDVAKRYKIKAIEREQKLGILKNYNDILFNQVKTDKMMILGADDWLRPDYLEKLDLDADIVSSDIVFVGEDAHRIRQGAKNEFKDGYWLQRFEPEKHSIQRVNYIHGSSLYNVELAQKFGYKGARNRIFGKRLMEDWMLFRSMIAEGKAKHIHVSEPLLFYRKHRKNINGVY